METYDGPRYPGHEEVKVRTWLWVLAGGVFGVILFAAAVIIFAKLCGL